MINQIVSSYAETQPDSMAIIDESQGVELSYKELDIKIDCLSKMLLSIGVNKGDRIAAWLFPSYQFYELFFACAKIGAILVPINTRYVAREVAYILKDSGSRVFIYDNIIQEGLEELKKVIEDHEICFLEINSLLKKLEKQNEKSFVDREIINQLKDPVLIIYTSAISRSPKGGMLTNENLIWSALSTMLRCSLKTEEINLSVSPIFHIGAFQLTFPAFLTGQTIVTLKKFNSIDVLSLIEKRKITNAFLPTPMLKAICEVEGLCNYNTESMRLVMASVANLTIENWEKIQSKFRNIVFGYGLTETTGAITITKNSNDIIDKHGTLGFPVPFVQLKVINDKMEDVASGEVGEVIVKGPQLFDGYWNESEENKRKFKDGWFLTSDLVKVDEDNYLYFVGRKERMIKTGGENVYASEVEEIIKEFSKIKEVTVVGIPDEKWGEIVKANIVPETGCKITEEEILGECKKKLALFKIPKIIEFNYDN